MSAKSLLSEMFPGAEIFWMTGFDEWSPLAALMGVIRG
jgi:hypothetical protein